MTSGQNAMDAEIMDCGSFFDQIDDFLDVPNDDMDKAMDSESLPPIDLDLFPPAAPYPCSDSVFSNLDISAELSVPYEDIVQLEWLSGFFEDSFSCGGLTIDQPPRGSPGKELSNHRFRTSSPVSVLDRSSSSSSCSAEKTSAVTAAAATSRCGRARSKRPRPKTVNFRPITVPPLPPPVVACAGPENSNESRLAITIPKESNPEHNKKKKNKKIKFTIPAATPADGDHTPPSPPIRKCLHCEITKTPQWRAGPMGPKTLCNACGVRYKSGRLFPEYRPAASPTFVPTVHSNSHKKVLQMRNKVDGRVTNSPIGLLPNAGIAIDYV